MRESAQSMDRTARTFLDMVARNQADETARHNAHLEFVSVVFENWQIEKKRQVAIERQLSKCYGMLGIML